MPATIVLTSLGSFGDVYPYIAIARGLKARGHRPVLATLAYYRQAIEAEGLELRPVGSDADPSDRALVRRIMDPVRGTEVIVRELLMPAIRETYTDLLRAVEDADLLVSHPITFAGPIVAEKRGLPWASTVLAPMSFFSAWELPVFPPVPWLVRLGSLGPVVARGVIGLARAMTRSWTEPARRLRAELGLPPAGDPLYEGQFSPHLVLGLFSPLLATPRPDWPPRTVVTGFPFYDGPSGALDPALAAFLDAGPPPIVFTLGSSAVMAAGDFFQVSVEAARRLGRRAVLLAGSDPANRPRNLGPDAIAVDYAPHSLVLPGAAAVVHQGGIGTTGQTLRSGRPALVVPFAHDQPDNALRLTRLGAARTVYPKRYTAPRAAAELRRLLDEPRYAERAREVGEIVRRERGVEDACDALEGLLAPVRPA